MVTRTPVSMAEIKSQGSPLLGHLLVLPLSKWHLPVFYSVLSMYCHTWDMGKEYLVQTFLNQVPMQAPAGTEQRRQ